MGRPDCSGGSHARARIRVICSGVKVPGQPGRGSSLRTSSMARRSVAAVSRHSRVTSLGKACCQRRRHRPTWWRSRPTRGAMASLSRPAKASKTMAARWVSRLATLVAVLSWRSTSCWRSLITTLAADPGMALSWLAHGQSGATREDSQTALPVEARFRLLALAEPFHDVLGPLDIDLAVVGRALDALLAEHAAGGFTALLSLDLH